MYSNITLYFTKVEINILVRLSQSTLQTEFKDMVRKTEIVDSDDHINPDGKWEVECTTDHQPPDTCTPHLWSLRSGQLRGNHRAVAW